MQSHRDIIKTASAVRGWAEAMAEGTYKAGDLNGMCAISSAELWRRLRDIGVQAKIRVWMDPDPDVGSTHVFLYVDDHVLDVTATQFRALRNKKVYFEHEKFAENYLFYHHAYEFDSDEELVRWQQKVEFVADQVAWF